MRLLWVASSSAVGAGGLSHSFPSTGGGRCFYTLFQRKMVVQTSHYQCHDICECHERIIALHAGGCSPGSVKKYRVSSKSKEASCQQESADFARQCFQEEPSTHSKCIVFPRKLSTWQSSFSKRSCLTAPSWPQSLAGNTKLSSEHCSFQSSSVTRTFPSCDSCIGETSESALGQDGLNMSM